MEMAAIVVSILLIAVVLLQSGKAESASQIIQGGTSDLFANRKERGFELFEKIDEELWYKKEV